MHLITQLYYPPMCIWTSTHIVALTLLSLANSSAIKQNSVLQLPDAHPMHPLLTCEGCPPFITDRPGSLALRLSCPSQACLILQKGEGNISAFQDKQVTLLNLRASCNAPGNTKEREDLENRPFCCLPVMRQLTFNHTMGHCCQWPRV